MMYFASPRRASQALMDIRPGARARKAVSARARMTRRLSSRGKSTRPAKRAAQPWQFWWDGPIYEG